jgi:manganese/zinc/iron transport system substrate-binding protein
VRLRAVLLVPAVLALAACTSAAADAGPVADRRVRVTTTTTFLTDAARRIGGDRVEVTGLMGPGVDPHLYRAGADDVRALREADLVVHGGLHLEGKMADLLDDVADRRATVAVGDAIAEADLLPAPKTLRGAGQYDPHVWFDVPVYAAALGSLADALAGVDPGSAQVYRANLAAYRAELADVDARVRAMLASIPERNRLLVTSHDAFAYFGRRYGLDVTAIQGISTAAEATTADVERVAGLLAARRVPAVFVETSVPHRTIDALVAATAQRGVTVKVGAELFTDAGGSAGTPEETYPGMVLADARRITAALGGRADR